MVSLKICVVVMSLMNLGLQPAQPKYGTFKVDVVSLLRDTKEAQGSEKVFADHQGYRYLFVDAANRDEFLKRPNRYEIQLGGACGKMAELTGRGSTDRYLVVNRRIYLFASDSCREKFKANPNGHIERDDRAPKANAAQLDRGGKLVQMARTWTGLDKLGDRARLSLVNNYQLTQGARTYEVKETMRVGPGTDYFEEALYDGSGYQLKIENGVATEIDPAGKPDALVPTWKRALERRRARSLVYLLAVPNRNRPLYAYKSTTGAISTVDVFVDRVLTTLRIQEGTGKVVGMTQRLRNADGVFGDVDRTFTQYATVEGVTFPIAWRATYNGVDSPYHSRTGDKIIIEK